MQIIQVNRSTLHKPVARPVLQGWQNYPGKSRGQEINFINMSMSALGVLEISCDSLCKPLTSLDLPEMHQKRLVSKVMAIAIRSTYYIFCRRSKDWTDPDLMDF